MCQIQDQRIIIVSCSKNTLFNSKKHIEINRKYKEEMEEVYDNASAFMHPVIKTNS